MINKKTEKISLKLSLVDSLVDGKEKLKSKTYNNINFTATNEALHSLGTTIVSLQEKPVSKILKLEESSLIQD